MKKIKINLYDGLCLFESKEWGGLKVYKQISPTIRASKVCCGVAMPKDNTLIKPIVVGNYSKSGHEASRILDPSGIAPTIKENHGTINAVVVNANCIENGHG